MKDHEKVLFLLLILTVATRIINTKSMKLFDILMLALIGINAVLEGMLYLKRRTQ